MPHTQKIDIKTKRKIYKTILTNNIILFLMDILCAKNKYQLDSYFEWIVKKKKKPQPLSAAVRYVITSCLL